MKNYLTILILVAVVIGCSSTSKTTLTMSENQQTATISSNQTNHSTMKLGAFSVSLNVKDINVSKQFYENLGFTVFAGDLKKNYLIMKNDKTLIGLFQGMFESNILTFNPGWDENAQEVNPFDDVRTIQKQLKEKGVEFATQADETTTGPASFVIADPDGNVILVDQHR